MDDALKNLVTDVRTIHDGVSRTDQTPASDGILQCARLAVSVSGHNAEQFNFNAKAILGMVSTDRERRDVYRAFVAESLASNNPTALVNLWNLVKDGSERTPENIFVIANGIAQGYDPVRSSPVSRFLNQTISEAAMGDSLSQTFVGCLSDQAARQPFLAHELLFSVNLSADSDYKKTVYQTLLTAAEQSPTVLHDLVNHYVEKNETNPKLREMLFDGLVNVAPPEIGAELIRMGAQGGVGSNFAHTAKCRAMLQNMGDLGQMMDMGAVNPYRTALPLMARD